MSNKKFDVDYLLKQALRSDGIFYEKPDLTQLTLKSESETSVIKKAETKKFDITGFRRSMSAAFTVVITLMFIAGAIFAIRYLNMATPAANEIETETERKIEDAIYIPQEESVITEINDEYVYTPTLTASEIVTKLGGRIPDKKLSTAFASEDAININAFATSGDYLFTLISMVSGKNISATFAGSNIIDENNIRTFFLVSVQRIDGKPMIYGGDNHDFCFLNGSPIIKGLDSETRGYIHRHESGFFSGPAMTPDEIKTDGVITRYCIISMSCDIKIFADKGLYLGLDYFQQPWDINNIQNLIYHRYGLDAYIYNEETDEIISNPDYKYANVVFELPIDKSYADPEKAGQYLEFIKKLGKDYEIADKADAEHRANIYDSNIPYAIKTVVEKYENKANPRPSFLYSVCWFQFTDENIKTVKFESENGELTRLFLGLPSDEWEHRHEEHQADDNGNIIFIDVESDMADRSARHGEADDDPYLYHISNNTIYWIPHKYIYAPINGEDYHEYLTDSITITFTYADGTQKIEIFDIILDEETGKISANIIK